MTNDSFVTLIGIALLIGIIAIYRVVDKICIRLADMKSRIYRINKALDKLADGEW